jgi:DinB superfamily
MPTIADPRTLADLVARLERLPADAPRRWGTMTAGEMLCHLGDAHESVLGVRVAPGPAPSGVSRPMLKWYALRSPMPWPKGVTTRPGVNPKLEGTRPGEFERDRARAIASLRALATATPATLGRPHFAFGPMSASDWHRWAYKHVIHHLRQFGA